MKFFLDVVFFILVEIANSLLFLFWFFTYPLYYVCIKVNEMYREYQDSKEERDGD